MTLARPVSPWAAHHRRWPDGRSLNAPGVCTNPSHHLPNWRVGTLAAAEFIRYTARCTAGKRPAPELSNRDGAAHDNMIPPQDTC